MAGKEKVPSVSVEEIAGIVLVAAGGSAIESEGLVFYLAVGSFLLGCLLLYFGMRRW